MATLYEQIQQALNEDISTGKMTQLKRDITDSLKGIYNNMEEFSIFKKLNTYSFKRYLLELESSLVIIIEKLVELDSRIEELENKGL